MKPRRGSSVTFEARLSPDKKKNKKSAKVKRQNSAGDDVESSGDEDETFDSDEGELSASF